jgi:hypothetical protein
VTKTGDIPMIYCSYLVHYPRKNSSLARVKKLQKRITAHGINSHHIN